MLLKYGVLLYYTVVSISVAETTHGFLKRPPSKATASGMSTVLISITVSTSKIILLLLFLMANQMLLVIFNNWVSMQESPFKSWASWTRRLLGTKRQSPSLLNMYWRTTTSPTSGRTRCVPVMVQILITVMIMLSLPWPFLALWRRLCGMQNSSIPAGPWGSTQVLP